MKDLKKTKDFGAPDEFGAHIFRVVIPASRADKVRIYEDYGYEGGENGIPYEEERVFLNHMVWSGISETARKNFMNA